MDLTWWRFSMSTLSFRRACALLAIPCATLALPVAHAAAEATDATLEEVIVTASPLHDPDYLATVVSVVDRSQLVREGGSNLADALAHEPGISGSGFAAGASRPVIRGFDANRVRVLEDGVGSFDVSDVGPDHGVPIDPLSAERIEVVRGPATLRYGSQAIGGVVNAINNRVPQSIPAATRLEGSAAWGSGADAREGSLLADGGGRSFAWHADGFVHRTGDYAIPGGTQPNSFFRGDGYAGGGSWVSGKDYVGVGVVHYDSSYGIPSDTTYIDMHQTKEMLRSSFTFEGGALQSLSVDGGHADYEHSEIDPATGTPNSTFRDHESDVRAELLFGKMGPLDGAALGAQAQDRDFSALGEGNDYLLPTRTRSHALFAFAELPFSKSVRMQGGARVERVTLDGTAPSGDAAAPAFTPASGSLGVVWDAAEKLRFGLTLTSAARAPAQTELFAHGAHDGPGTYETGDPSLGLERANSAEVSLRWQRPDSEFHASLWAVQFSHFIYGRLTGLTCDDAGTCGPSGGDLRQLQYMQGDASFKGLELHWERQVAAGGYGALEFQAMGDLVRATLDAGGNVPRIPPWHAGAGLHWEHGAFDAGAFLKYSGAQDQPGEGDTPTAGFAALDAHLGWRPLATHPGLELTLIGRNLTDSVQRNAAALNKDAVVGPGRELRLVLRASL
jgi:iron complex outermembrane recepter protein